MKVITTFFLLLKTDLKGVGKDDLQRVYTGKRL